MPFGKRSNSPPGGGAAPDSGASGASVSVWDALQIIPRRNSKPRGVEPSLLDRLSQIAPQAASAEPAPAAAEAGAMTVTGAEPGFADPVAGPVRDTASVTEELLQATALTAAADEPEALAAPRAPLLRLDPFAAVAVLPEGDPSPIETGEIEPQVHSRDGPADVPAPAPADGWPADEGAPEDDAGPAADVEPVQETSAADAVLEPQPVAEAAAPADAPAIVAEVVAQAGNDAEAEAAASDRSATDAARHADTAADVLPPLDLDGAAKAGETESGVVTVSADAVATTDPATLDPVTTADAAGDVEQARRTAGATVTSAAAVVPPSAPSVTGLADNGDGDDAQPDPRQFVSFLALSAPGRTTAATVAEACRALARDGATIEPLTLADDLDGHAMALAVNGHAIIAMTLAEPIPADVPLTGDAQAAAAARAGAAHTALALIEPVEGADALDGAEAVTLVLAAMASLLPATAAVFAFSGVCTSTEDLRSDARHFALGQTPIRLWVDVTLRKAADGPDGTPRLAASTRGLHVFAGREIELGPAALDAADLRRRALAMAAHLAVNGDAARGVPVAVIA